MARKIKVYENVLTNNQTRALALNNPVAQSIDVSDTTSRNHRATGLNKKERVSINVYGRSSAVIYVVDTDVLQPIVARFLSQLDSLSQANCTKIK